MGIRRARRLDGARFAWGDEEVVDGKRLANTWQVTFLAQHEGRTASRDVAVKSFPPNGYGLYDMCGNVWGWTSDFFTMRHPDDVEKPCCVPRNPRVTSPQSPD